VILHACTLNNTFYHNNFANNTLHVDVLYSLVNYWDNDKGDYWSDYKGTDNNGSGIGGTPYVIDGDNQDNFPIMNPFVIPEFSVEENPKVPSIEPFPIWIVAAIATIAVVGAALLVYFVKTKKTTGKAEK